MNEFGYEAISAPLSDNPGNGGVTNFGSFLAIAPAEGDFIGWFRTELVDLSDGLPTLYNGYKVIPAVPPGSGEWGGGLWNDDSSGTAFLVGQQNVCLEANNQLVDDGTVVRLYRGICWLEGTGGSAGSSDEFSGSSDSGSGIDLPWQSYLFVSPSPAAAGGSGTEAGIGSGENRVVTNVQCVDGELVVTYGTI